MYSIAVAFEASDFSSSGSVGIAGQPPVIFTACRCLASLSVDLFADGIGIVKRRSAKNTSIFAVSKLIVESRIFRRLSAGSQKN